MYTVQISNVAEKDLNKIPDKYYKKIKQVLSGIEIDPRPVGCLKLSILEGYRIRVGQFRVLYEIIDDKKIVNVYRIRHRKDAYK